jgi:NAD(P)-dependent dehydrogenase (short-subunit alcohol dehydrogenase family)
MHPNLEQKLSLKNKVVIITGGCGLLGLKHAEAVIEADGIPILFDKSEEIIDKGIAYLENLYPHSLIEGYVVNITKEQEIISAKDELLTKHKKIDVLINNACNNHPLETVNTRLETLSGKLWHDDLAVGLTGSFLCCQIFGSIMAQQNEGNILNISSDLGLIAPDQRLYKKEKPKPITYSVVKHGIIGLTRYIATYWAENKVRCNALCIGGVFNNQSTDFVMKLTNIIPMGRMANVNEYKSTIIYLCSEASSYMTGAILTIDGGRTCW